MGEPRVTTLIVRKMVDHLVEHGVDRGTLLKRAGVPAGAFRPSRLRLPWVFVEDLLEAAAGLMDDDRLGFHLAREHDLETLGLPGLLFYASRDVGVGLRRLTRAARLWSDAYSLTLEEPKRAEATARYRFELHRPERPALAHLRENHMAVFTLVMRHLVGRTPLAVHLTHSRDGELAEYEEWFGCPVSFGAGETAALLDPEALAVPMATANALFAEHFQTLTRKALAALQGSGSTATRLREVLAVTFSADGGSEPSLATSAAAMKTTPRSLQRALRREGTSFRKELETVRRAEAERLLSAGVAIAEVSWRLGYSEPPVFHRAFKRWTGESPEAWRRAHADR